jgi:hypothetical protein
MLTGRRIVTRFVLPTLHVYRRTTTRLLSGTQPHPVQQQQQQQQQQVTQLLRDYIGDCLYHKEFGYFATATPPLQPARAAIDFGSLASRHEYHLQVKKRYGDHPRAWATPVELFQPWYGRAIANRIIEADERMRQSVRCGGNNDRDDRILHIVEVGGGNGTLAASMMPILEHYCNPNNNNPNNNPNNKPHRVRYDIVELSQPLAARQRHILRHWIDRQMLHVHEASIVDWLAQHTEPLHHVCHMVMLEVLDNMPHDLVTGVNSASQPFDVSHIEHLQQVHVQQTKCVESPAISEYSLVSAPLSDALLIRACQAWSSASTALHTTGVSNSGASWRMMDLSSITQRLAQYIVPSANDEWYVPTTAHATLEQFARVFPRHSLTIADFDTLPDVLSGKNAPLIQQLTPAGAVVSFDAILQPEPGSCDIMFPTDFEALAAAHRAITTQVASCSGGHYRQSRGQVLRSAEFLAQYAEHANTATKSGYNPMLDEFANTLVYLGDTVVGAAST